MNEVNFKQVIQNIREAINPETRIPEHQKDSPVYYRIQRLKELIKDIEKNQKQTQESIQKVITNFNELLVEINHSDPCKKTTVENENK